LHLNAFVNNKTVRLHSISQRIIKYKMFLEVMFIYYPGNSFPSISITGEFCALRCKHCNGHYLKGMLPITTPEKLIEFAKKNDGKINGFLLSGGSTKEGKVPIKKFAPAVKWIVENTSLTVNIHTGIIDESDIEYLEDMHPHHISFDVIGSTETIRRVIGIDKTKEDYFHALDLLDSSSLNYSPHIIAGLDFGEIKGEYDALEKINNLKRFANLVLIVLIPTKGTPMENVILNRKEILEFFDYALSTIPPKKIVLGCMRPRNFYEVEEICVKRSCKGIVIPSLKTIRLLRERKMSIIRKDMCCVF